MTDSRRTIHVSGVRCRWCLQPYQPHRLCTQSPTAEATACMPESEDEERRAIPPAPETRVPCPAPSLPCTACGAEPGTDHEWVPLSRDESWRVAHGHEPRSRNSSADPTRRRT